MLLLATAFGVAMPGLIDLALLGEHRADAPYWEALLRLPTLIAAPLALLHALGPRPRGRPLLGRSGLAVVFGLGVIAAIFVHADGRRTYDYAPGLGQVVGVALVVLMLALPRFPLRTATAHGSIRSTCRADGDLAWWARR